MKASDLTTLTLGALALITTHMSLSIRPFGVDCINNKIILILLINMNTSIKVFLMKNIDI